MNFLQILVNGVCQKNKVKMRGLAARLAAPPSNHANRCHLGHIKQPGPLLMCKSSQLFQIFQAFSA